MRACALAFMCDFGGWRKKKKTMIKRAMSRKYNEQYDEDTEDYDSDATQPILDDELVIPESQPPSAKRPKTVPARLLDCDYDKEADKKANDKSK